MAALDGRAVPQALAERLLLWSIPDLAHRAREDADHYEALGLAPLPSPHALGWEFGGARRETTARYPAP